MKKFIIKNFSGIEYVNVIFENYKEDPVHGPIIHSKQIHAVELGLSKIILKQGRPIRGKELKLFRSACEISTRELGQAIGVSHVAIIDWEKNYADKRLTKMQEIAIRSYFSEFLKIKINGFISSLYPKETKEKDIKIVA